MGISRPRTKVLRTRAYFSATNTLLRSHSNESTTMRDSESQMQRAPVHEDLMIFTIESIKDLELRYDLADH